MAGGCYKLLSFPHPRPCQVELKNLLLFDLKRSLEHGKPKKTIPSMFK